MEIRQVAKATRSLQREVYCCIVLGQLMERGLFRSLEKKKKAAVRPFAVVSHSALGHIGGTKNKVLWMRKTST